MLYNRLILNTGVCMSAMPLVSVMIPAYNHAQYVTQTLDSILKDGYGNKEIVIIDDGSADETDLRIREWIDRYGDTIPVKYKSRPNQGLTRTLNELLSMAEGEYLVALASDDYLLPGGIAARLRYLQEHPDKSAVFADAMVVDAAGNVISESALFGYRHASKKNLMSDAGIRREFLTNFAMPGPVLMVRRDFYRKFGGYDDEMYMEDYDLYLRFAGYNLIGFLDERVSAYRLHDANMSDRNSPRYLRLLEDSRKTLLKHKELFRGYERGLLYWQVLKFGIRIAILKRRLRQ